MTHYYTITAMPVGDCILIFEGRCSEGSAVGYAIRARDTYQCPVVVDQGARDARQVLKLEWVDSSDPFIQAEIDRQTEYVT